MEIEEEITQNMLDQGIIVPSTSEWAAAPVLLRKRNGGYRYANDYRKLNAVTRISTFPWSGLATA